MTRLTKRQLHGRVPRGKHREDPMVPLHADRLRAALDQDGRGVAEVAKAVHASKQRLHHLAQRARRCRASLRRALARTLRVPEPFLAGARAVLSSPRAYLAVEQDAPELMALLERKRPR